MKVPCRLLGSGESHRCVQLGIGSPSGAHHISTLPDDLLLLVLARLRCAAATARTSVLARRWHGLWTSLPALAFRDVAFRSLKKALHALARDDAVVSSFNISVADEPRTTRGVNSVLRAAARFLPEELALAIPSGVGDLYHPVDLPFLGSATSISLSMGKYPVELLVEPAPPAGSGECLFPALTTLFISGYYAADGLADLVAHCPRLLVLSYAVRYLWRCSLFYAMTVHSATLRELFVEYERVHRVDVAAPMLEQLTMSFFAGHDLTLSVVAPMAEEVSWRCRYGYPGFVSSGWHTAFGDWILDTVTLMTSSSRETGAPMLRIDAVTSHSRYSNNFDDFPDDYLEQEVEKHLQLQVAADFSVLDLELHLTAGEDHVYAAIVLYLLGMRRICSAARSLKLVRLIPEEDLKACDKDCCCEPTEWRSKTITLTKLEEVEIDGFQGDDHEFDFLELVFRCAPMLKKVIVKHSIKLKPNDGKNYYSFRLHPSVEFYVLSS